MAETSDDDFKAEMLDLKSQMLQFIEIADQKFDGLTSDVRTNGYRIDKLENQIEKVARENNNRFDRFETGINSIADNVSIMSSQFTSVTGKVIDNDQILVDLEARVAVLEGEIH